MATKPTHATLVKKAASLLKYKLGCRIVLTEHYANTRYGETPDAVGWRTTQCMLVECKASRSDYLRDKKKPFRDPLRPRAVGMGAWRFYLTPPNIITLAELPKGWGLYELHGRSVKFIGMAPNHNRYDIRMYEAHRGAPPFKSCVTSEKAMLLSALAKAKGL